ncbi:MAG: OsmC family protein [Anaerolineaceae bacterium]|nr:OsmC family protein [Anaerolineaceae bacterium]
MAEAKVQWLGGGTYLGVDSTQHSVVLSTPTDNVGMKPSEMLLVALASCTAVDVVNISAKKKQPLSSLEIQVKAEQDENPPWPFRKIHLHYVASGEGLTDAALSKAIELSEEKYCSVSATVRGVAEITTSFEIV